MTKNSDLILLSGVIASCVIFAVGKSFDTFRKETSFLESFAEINLMMKLIFLSFFYSLSLSLLNAFLPK